MTVSRKKNSRHRFGTKLWPMTMRPCIPQTSSIRPSPPFDCLHFNHPESDEPTNTWDELNGAYTSFTDDIARSLGWDTDSYTFEELARALDAGAVAMDRHVIDLMYELGDDEEVPDPDTLRAMGVAVRGKPEDVVDVVDVSAPDLEVINRHRRGLGMEPIDLGAGWSIEELRQMADTIRTTGRMGNPVQVLKRRLMR